MGWRSWLSALAVVLVGTAAFAAATDGFQAVTSEGARRLSVSRSPRLLPSTELEDQDGRIFRLDDYRGTVVVVEFIYARCPTLCTLLGGSFAQVGRRLGPALDGGRLVLVSISFDPEGDVAALKAYAAAQGADGRRWRVARFRDAKAGRRLLDTCNVVIIPNGQGGFDHNAAAYLIGRTSRLVAIVDPSPVDALIDELKPWL